MPVEIERNLLGHYALPGLAERGIGGIGFTTHYFEGQPELLKETLDVMAAWIDTHV